MYERTDLMIELGGFVMDFDDMRRYFKCSPQPQFWVYTETEATDTEMDERVYRASEGDKHRDVFITFRNLNSLGDFSLHEYFTEKKNLALREKTLETIAFSANKETVVVIDPVWEEGLVYDTFFLISFASHNHANR
jgi:hypothetical protein